MLSIKKREQKSLAARVHREIVLLPTGGRPQNSKGPNKKESSRINLQPNFGLSYKVLFSSLLRYESTETLEFSQILINFWFQKVGLHKFFDKMLLNAIFTKEPNELSGRKILNRVGNTVGKCN